MALLWGCKFEGWHPGPHPGMSQWLVARCGVLPGRAEEEPGHSATSWEHEKCGVKDGVL